jgi:hypothetical protein
MPLGSGLVVDYLLGFLLGVTSRIQGKTGVDYNAGILGQQSQEITLVVELYVISPSTAVPEFSPGNCSQSITEPQAQKYATPKSPKIRTSQNE